MLPQLLCEQLCSLNPNVERLSFSVVWTMTPDGLITGGEPVCVGLVFFPLYCCVLVGLLRATLTVWAAAQWFGKSVIKSCAKLDYGIAQTIIDGAITDDMVASGDIRAFVFSRRRGTPLSFSR